MILALGLVACILDLATCLNARWIEFTSQEERESILRPCFLLASIFLPSFSCQAWTMPPSPARFLSIFPHAWRAAAGGSRLWERLSDRGGLAWEPALCRRAAAKAPKQARSTLLALCPDPEAALPLWPVWKRRASLAKAMALEGRPLAQAGSPVWWPDARG